MRTLLAATLTALVLLNAVPLASSQGEAATPLAEDPAGDVTGTPIGGPTQPVTGFEDVDLTGLFLSETPSTFDLRLRFAHMDGEAGPDQPGSYTYLSFDGVDYRVWLGRSADNAAWFGSLASREGDAFFSFVGPLDARYDVDAAEVWTTLDRTLLLGSTGRLPANGDELTGIRAESWANAGHSTSFNNPVPGVPMKGYLLDIGDRVPDIDGTALGIVFGGAMSAGGITLTASEPYRASNGAATTYVYDLVASNQAEGDRTLTLEAMHLPTGWNVTFPGDVVTLEVGATVEFQVAVATPFMHAHGSSQSFHLKLSDPADATAWAMVELGVHFLKVAQPAGHHDVLYLHTHPWSETAAYVNPPLGGTTGIVTMNTLEEDAEDAGVPVVAYAGLANTGGEFYGWAACLDPGLAMGLDFDLTRLGSIAIPVSSDRPLNGAVLSGRLLHVTGDLDTTSCYPSTYNRLEVIELATIDASPATSIGPKGTHTFETSITPLADADRVPYQAGAQLVLELSVRADGVGIGGTGGLTLQPGGRLQLPLDEYADAVPLFMGATDVPEGSSFSDGTSAAPKDAPAVALPLLVVGMLALVALVRRR